MIEPWVTPWSSLIYKKLHHEPFQPRAEGWKFLRRPALRCQWRQPLDHLRPGPLTFRAGFPGMGIRRLNHSCR